MNTQAGNRLHRIVIVGGGAGGLELATRLGLGDPEVVALTGIYHNLLRRWAVV